ncbi:Putative HlyD-family transporter [Flavobacterium indicum GPTSA100-9 = DSM 17447]|uniref:Putative HlyD-family transporter n=1 Tax=Flavobacterium indicum (strain DSM 17447 / CIP 109464 / GPTSA100-9) TaxID=1094466 RepID=H8XSV3_FLAIG|nr:HlyD family efflux transporter periplasmic adaptor subunit [Flavobacterium indicum]CCG53495.1 Putative HlyD-family transporter [Flavobacterium indicum GPTSA100-9 = DSM 17447]
MPNHNEIELRSEEVQDILTKIPHWIIRWGSLVVLVILLLLFLVSWMVKYPDIITTEITITTQIPPEKLVAKTSGKIQAILIDDKAIVNENTPLAVIENAANYKDVFLLKVITDTISLSNSKFPFEKLQAAQLGEIENSFAMFQKEYIASELNKQLQPYKVESSAQNFEAKQLRDRLELLEGQKDINQSELQLLKTDVERYEKLFKKGVISVQEIEKQRLVYLQAEKNYKSLLSSISQLKSSINELNRSSKTTVINESTTSINLERSVMQSFYQLKKAIKDWELNYVFRSSVKGTVSFLQIWSENQTINAGENMFAIIPSTEKGYIGKVKAVAQNSGKLQIGQKVNIRLANYPDREFGVIEGKLKTISLTPDKEGNLLLDIELPNGLQTSYKKQVNFQQEMTGTADIITEDLRLLERLLYQFRDVFRR